MLAPPGWPFLELGVDDGVIVARTDSLGAGLTKQIAFVREKGDIGDQYNAFLDCEEVAADAIGHGDVLIGREGKLLRPKRLPSNLYQFRPGTGEDRCVLDCITALQHGADLLWIETEKPHIAQIAGMVDRIREVIPNAKLVYNNSPSFNWTLPLVAWFLLRKYFGARHNGRVGTLLVQFPDALATIVRAVRVGIPVGEAIRAVAMEAAEPTRGEFARLADDVAIGLSLEEALRGMAARNGVPEYRFFATALSLQAQTGGAIGETLDGLAEVIRKRVAARARGKAMAAEARTSALVLSVLPAIAMAGLWMMNPPYIGVLFTTETGNTVLAAAALLLGLGAMAMRAMIARSLS